MIIKRKNIYKEIEEKEEGKCKENRQKIELK